ncbi:MAG: glutamine synthetase III [Oscillospiraceae bacterium]|nr:glutamine synthetase III [Oscillospiraceae bacterium]
MNKINHLFGSMVFNDAVMKSRLPKDSYKALKKTIEHGVRLELDVANVVANAMKDWAVEKGATHYTHWFQPMTGATAEKHDSFISPQNDGGVIMEFSGKSLVHGEPDASSFPSGGIRATFEARGYTIWDTTSYAFIKDGSLCIPTAFCSYTGEALDKKTPLLRSMEAINKQAMRILKLFEANTSPDKCNCNGVERVIAQVGAEQEYFLIDAEIFKKRPDLVFAGRTLLGAPPPKGQELDDHYFGVLKPRVSAFMKELDEELWKLGIYSCTKHNEVAPAQHELAPIFTTANIATDHNQLTMEIMKIVARRHGLVCLLHEKPFAGINGSGKHNNWSLSTDTGVNLLQPGSTPYENAQFLLFLTAIIKSVDTHQDLLRVSAASAGNDHRLGANEAPPAIISIFLGEELTEILEAIETGTRYKGKEEIQMEIGVTTLPHFPKDTTDRNRTSPFAFTGNKFEFRMLGSAFSISGPNITLNTIVAESLRQFADELENSSPADFKKNLAKMIKTTFTKHKRIVFNGDNYSDEWVTEAVNRGLSNHKSTVEALPALIRDDSFTLFETHGVFTKTELQSRFEIRIANYAKTINIEALTMVNLVKNEILPACMEYQDVLAKLLERKIALKQHVSELDISAEKHLMRNISTLTAKLLTKLIVLESTLAESSENLAMQNDVQDYAKFYRESVFTAMCELRLVADELETLVAKKYWPLPSYAALLYSVV